MSGEGLEPRQTTSWIGTFCEFADISSAIPIWAKWAAISVLAGALERRVWMRSRRGPLYPNLYSIIVGPPGVGKSVALNLGEQFLRTIEAKQNVPGIFIAPSSVSAASLLDALHDARRKIIRPKDTPSVVEFNYFTAFVSELGIFLPEYDSRFITRLIKFYDGEHFEERLRSREQKQVVMETPQVSIFGGTTPSYLNSLLPEGAWDQGFCSRTIFIFNPVSDIIHSIFDTGLDLEKAKVLKKALVEDLHKIFNLYGEFHWAEDAKEAIEAWNQARLPPKPSHRNLEHYNSRRLAHVMKLSMIASAARGSDLIIKLEDYQSALDWLLEAEARMPDIFHAFGGLAQDGKAMEDLWYFVFKEFSLRHKAIPKHELINYLKNKVQSASILKVIDLMVEGRLLKFTGDGYLPGEKLQ